MKKKIQLVLDEEAQSVLADLVESTNADSMAHVLRDALGVYNGLYKILSHSTGVLAVVDRQRNEFQELSITSFAQPASIRMGNRNPLR